MDYLYSIFLNKIQMFYHISYMITNNDPSATFTIGKVTFPLKHKQLIE